MLKGMDGSYQASAEARSYAEAYSQPKPEQFSAIDLGDFARLIEERGAQGDITAPAQALRQVLDQARIAEWHGNFHGRSTGMSVFFPQVAELYNNAYEQASPLPQATSWATFLKAFHNSGTTQVSAPEITNLQISSPTVGINNPLTLQGTVSGKDIAYVFFFVGVPQGGQSVALTDIDFIYPPGSSPNANVPPWSDGTNDLSQTWDGTRWALSNGTDTIPVLLGPAKYGTDQYGVEGIYTAKDTGEQTSAGLLFQVSQGRATLQSIWGFPEGQKQEAQPFELSPVAGDTFTPSLRSYSVEDNKLVPDFAEGETLTFGDQPLNALQVPANSGDYVSGFLSFIAPTVLTTRALLHACARAHLSDIDRRERRRDAQQLVFAEAEAIDEQAAAGLLEYDLTLIAVRRQRRLPRADDDAALVTGERQRLGRAAADDQLLRTSLERDDEEANAASAQLAGSRDPRLGRRNLHASRQVRGPEVDERGCLSRRRERHGGRGRAGARRERGGR